MRKTLSDKGVAALKHRDRRYTHPDPELRGHWVRVQAPPSTVKSFVVVARNPDGKQVRATIGPIDALTINEAREKARATLQRIRAGLPASEAKGESFADVVARWRKRHVEANALRSAREINRLLDTHVLPAWRGRAFTSIRRSDVAELLDHVEDRHGARAADYVLECRSLDYELAGDAERLQPADRQGHAAQKTASRARVLDDDELRAVWLAAEAHPSAFSAILRLCLFTAQRSRKVASMRWDDVEAGVWTVPKEPREKGTGGALAPKSALAIVEAQPQFVVAEYVFPARGASGPFCGFRCQQGGV